jgi:transcriptional regulator with XRE-family HTH domain
MFGLFGGAKKKCRLKSLADAADVDRTYVSLLERGLRQPTLEMLFSLSRALNVSPSTMVSRTASLAG